MRHLCLVLITVSMFAAPASAHVDEGASFSRTHIMTAFDAVGANGTVGWFMMDGGEEANPTLRVHEGEAVLIIFVNAGNGSHELELGAPVDNSTDRVEPGAERYLWFRAPETADSLVYQDPDWSTKGMVGMIEILRSGEPVHESPATHFGPLLVFLVVGGAFLRRRSV